MFLHPRPTFIYPTVFPMRSRSAAQPKRHASLPPARRSKRLRKTPTATLDHSSLQSDLHSRLKAASDPTYQIFLTKYLRGEIPVLGLRTPAIKKVTSAWAHDHGFSELDVCDAKNVALKLFEMDHIEEKMVATLLLHEHLGIGKELTVDDLHHIADLFDKGYIYGWASTDSFAMRVVRKIAEKGGEGAVRKVADWRFADNLWRARSSVVGLLRLARNEEEREVLIDCCRILVKREERFAKTCVGWAMREISRWSKEHVFEFLEENAGSMSMESVRNATKRCTEAEKKKYVSLVKRESRS